MTFQPGNKLAKGGRKDKPFRDALVMEIKAAGEDHKALRAIANALLLKAQEGDIQAIKEIADRLDGKPLQEQQHSGEVTQSIIHVPLPLETEQWEQKYSPPVVQ